MRRKILALDIDGTLTNSKKEITPATKASLQELMRAGHRLILASGRPTPGMQRYARELEMERYGGYLLSFNGARVVECSTGEVIFQRTLPLRLIPGLYAFARDHGCGLATHLDSRAISAFEPDRYIALEAGMNGMSVEVAEDFVGFVDFPIYKCLMTAEPERAAVLEQALLETYGVDASIYRSDPYFIEVMPQNVDKAQTLGKMLEIIGGSWEDVVCCGDGYNDISMIERAKVGVAMGNAQPEVKAAADFVAADNDSDGLVEVVRRFMTGDGAYET